MGLRPRRLIKSISFRGHASHEEGTDCKSPEDFASSSEESECHELIVGEYLYCAQFCADDVVLASGTGTNSGQRINFSSDKVFYLSLHLLPVVPTWFELNPSIEMMTLSHI